MIDSHTHLDSCAPPNDALVAAATAAGVTRILTVGMDEASNRSALAASETFPQVYAAVGRHPNHAEAFDDAALADIEHLAAHAGCAAIGETGLDYYRDTAPRADQERAFHAQIDVARATGKPLVIHTRAADDDTIATLRARADQERAFHGQIELARATGKPLVIHTRAAEDDTIAMLKQHAGGLEVILHCFSMPARLDECLERGWWISFAGNVTYPKAEDLAEAAERVPLDRLLVETDAPYLTPVPHRGKPNRPAYVPLVGAAVEANAARLLGW